jgi:hypothetical protein
MSEQQQQDPSGNTARFRAFVEQAQVEDAPKPGVSRGMLIGGIVVLAIIVIVILAVAL